jgi:hypothetical protein
MAVINHSETKEPFADIWIRPANIERATLRYTLANAVQSNLGGTSSESIYAAAPWRRRDCPRIRVVVVKPFKASLSSRRTRRLLIQIREGDPEKKERHQERIPFEVVH